MPIYTAEINGKSYDVCIEGDDIQLWTNEETNPELLIIEMGGADLVKRAWDAGTRNRDDVWEYCHRNLIEYAKEYYTKAIICQP